MSFSETVALGAIAGFTIYLGLPLGRIKRIDDRLRVGLAMFSVGILAFIFMDVTEPRRGDPRNGARRISRLIRLASATCSACSRCSRPASRAGTAGISVAERWLRSRRAALAPLAGGEAATVLDAQGLARSQEGAEDVRRRALQTGMMIAMAIGLHNFAEGLAIGVSAKAGAIGLATVLIIGFGLHNATEGFGIVGPLGGVRPSWRWLGLSRTDRRRSHIPGHHRRLPGQLRSARASLLRACRGRDPVRDRRDLDGNAPLRLSHARAVPARRRGSSSAWRPILIVSYGGG